MAIVARLIKKYNHYHCSYCLMRVPKEVPPRCPFCDAEFSNYEAIIIKEEGEHHYEDLPKM